MSLNGKNFAYFICESIRNADGNFIPCIAVENEAGYHKTDWEYGKDKSLANEAIDSCNKGLGLTPERAAEIVASSMGAQRRKKGEASFSR